MSAVASSSPTLRRAGWSMLVAVAAGVIAGGLVGGVGGRLAMLVLRLTSPDELHGMQTDNEFEIGVVTLASVQLIASLAATGAVNGAIYALLRRGIPTRWRLPVWTVFGAALGGAAIIDDDGVDFTLLEPLVLAIVMFVVLPGAASAVVVVLAERWERLEPFGSRRRTLALLAVSLLGTVGVIVAAVLTAILIAIDSIHVRRAYARLATVAVTGALLLVSLAAAADVLRTSARIL